ALIVEPDGKDASLSRVRYAIGPASTFHPRDLDRMPGAKRNGFPADECVVTHPFELLVVIDAGGAFAEADLRPHVDIDLDAAWRRLATERPADPPLVDRKRPFEFRPGRPQFRRWPRRHALDRPRRGHHAEPGDCQAKHLLHAVAVNVSTMPRSRVADPRPQCIAVCVRDCRLAVARRQRRTRPLLPVFVSFVAANLAANFAAPEVRGVDIV